MALVEDNVVMDIIDSDAIQTIKGDTAISIREILSGLFAFLATEEYEMKERIILFEAMLEYALGPRLYRNPNLLHRDKASSSPNTPEEVGEIIHVLLVEQDQEIKKTMIRLLESDPGIMVIRAEGSSQGVGRMAESRQPDLIIVDAGGWQMDNMVAAGCACLAPWLVVMDWRTEALKKAAKVAQAFGAGAVAVVPKPLWINHPVADLMTTGLIENVKGIYRELKALNTTGTGVTQLLSSPG